MMTIIAITKVITKDKSMPAKTNNEKMNVRLDRKIDP